MLHHVHIEIMLEMLAASIQVVLPAFIIIVVYLDRDGTIYVFYYQKR